MRNIMLFEAFRSNALSKIFRYLKSDKKLNNNEINLFKSALSQIRGIYDIPLDNISDEYIKYMNYNTAIKLKSGDVNNKWGVYAIKFWFSISKGYLGFSGIGNEEYKFSDYGNFDDRFSSRELEYIKNNLGIKTGILTPVRNGDLSDGDLVLAYYSSSSSIELSRLGLGKVSVSNGNFYASQNVSDGDGRPISGYIYSWSLGTVYRQGNDTFKLHKYRESSDELRYTIVEVDDSPYDYNLPINSDGYCIEWYDKLGGKLKNDYIESADFSIVFYLDNFLQSDLKRPSVKKAERIDNREGAIKLMSDEQIKDINFKRYVSKLLDDMGIKDDINLDKLTNLEKFVLKSISGRWSLFNIYNSDYRDINNIYSIIRNLISSTSMSDKKYYYDGIMRIYNLNKYSHISLNYDSSYRIFNELNDNKYASILMDGFIDIGEYISKSFMDKRLSKIGELKVAYYKIETIKNILIDNDFKMSIRTLDFIEGFNYINSRINLDKNNQKRFISDSLNYLKNRDDEIIKDIKKLEDIKEYVKSIL